MIEQVDTYTGRWKMKPSSLSMDWLEGDIGQLNQRRLLYWIIWIIALVGIAIYLLASIHIK